MFFFYSDRFVLFVKIDHFFNKRKKLKLKSAFLRVRKVPQGLTGCRKDNSSITVLAMGRRRGTPPGNCIFFSLIHAPLYPIYQLFFVSFRLIFGKIGTQTAAFGRSLTISFCSRYTVFSMDRDPWVSWTISFHSLSWIG